PSCVARSSPATSGTPPRTTTRGGSRTNGSPAMTTDVAAGNVAGTAAAAGLAGTSDERPELDLLVWDAPNVDMTLSNVIGGRPTPSSRPRFDAVARWLLTAAGDREVEGTVFANVPPGGAVSMRGWIEAIRSFGYDVFARPKLGPDD